MGAKETTKVDRAYARVVARMMVAQLKSESVSDDVLTGFLLQTKFVDPENCRELAEALLDEYAIVDPTA